MTLSTTDILARTDAAIEMIEQGMAEKADVLSALAFVEQVGQVYRTLKGRCEGAAMSWIEKNGDIEDGAVRLYVGTARTHRCRDKREFIARLLEQGCTPEVLAQILTAQPFKSPSTTRELVGPDIVSEMFETVEQSVLETGKPRKVLKKARPGLAEDKDDDTGQ